MKFVIITGMSGAGKSSVIKHMEDMGFFCIDNLPPALINKFVEICMTGEGKFDKVALVIDIRGGKMLNDFLPCVKNLQEMGIVYEILFLDALDEVLIKRYKGSRRMHPLAVNGMLIDGIRAEREKLKAIKDRANHIIDTSSLTSRNLKDEINNIYLEENEYKGIIINIISFGFKYGLPVECDLVFDVRFLTNPYYIDELKRLSGKDEKVRDFVLNMDNTKIFIDKLIDMLDFLTPNYKKEGKSQLVIGIGCTGGRHRSVAIAERVFSILKSHDHRVIIDHRDIDKDNKRFMQ